MDVDARRYISSSKRGRGILVLTKNHDRNATIRSASSTNAKIVFSSRLKKDEFPCLVCIAILARLNVSTVRNYIALTVSYRVYSTSIAVNNQADLYQLLGIIAINNTFYIQ